MMNLNGNTGIQSITFYSGFEDCLEVLLLFGTLTQPQWCQDDKGAFYVSDYQTGVVCKMHLVLMLYSATIAKILLDGVNTGNMFQHLVWLLRVLQNCTVVLLL